MFTTFTVHITYVTFAKILNLSADNFTLSHHSLSLFGFLVVIFLFLTRHVKKRKINNMAEFTWEEVEKQPAYQHVVRLAALYQTYLDKSVPFTTYRWAGLGVLLLLFLTRILLVQGWYIVCYSLGIYLLNLFLAFLTPKFDPSLEQEMQNENIEEGVPEDDGRDEEFRPFIRRLPEFKFWYKASVATTISLVATFFSFTDIPVFWPILLMYFIILFTLTMRKQIQHMIKYKYLPFDFGKAKYSKK